MPRYLPAQTTTILASISQLAGLFQHYSGKFIWFEWESAKKVNKTILKADAPAGSRLKINREPNPYANCTVTKRYCASMRNNFSFENRVRKIAEQRGVEVPQDWKPEKRTWGGQVKGTPLVLHELQDDGVHRVYTKLQPIKYNNNDLTGYYVDGVRVENQKEFEARYMPPKSVPRDAFAKVRKDAHPVSARLENTLFVRMGGNTYQLPETITVEEIEAIAALVASYDDAA